MSNINQTVTGTITGMFGCSGNNRTEDENPTIILEEGPDDIWTPPPPEEEDENMKGLPPDSKNSFVVHAISGKVAGAPSARWKEFALDSTSSWGTVPFKEAVLGGKLRNETPLYVARVKLRCGIHPASVSKSFFARNTGEGYSLTTHDGDVIQLFNQRCEMLLLGNPRELRWKIKRRNVEPKGAVVAGMDAVGNFMGDDMDFVPNSPPAPLWVARAFMKGGVYIGKAGAHIGKGNMAMIPINGEYHTTKDFEVLVAVSLDGPEEGEDPEEWNPGYGPEIPRTDLY